MRTEYNRLMERNEAAAFLETYICLEQDYILKAEKKSAQYTISENRLKALKILERILCGEETDLAEAAFAEPKISSLLRKLCAAREKAAGSSVPDPAFSALEAGYRLLEEQREAFDRDGLCMALRLCERKNQIWFSKENPILRQLTEKLRGENRRTIVLWGLSLAEETAGALTQRCPGDDRPLHAVEAGRLWASGFMKMPAAKRAILDCHAMAKETDPVSALLCHAVGQGVSVVHTTGHALGLPVYELTALALKEGFPACRKAVEERAEIYVQRLEACSREEKEYAGPWASFLEQEKRQEERE